MIQLAARGMSCGKVGVCVAIKSCWVVSSLKRGVFFI